MKFCDFVSTEAIQSEMASVDKESAIRELVGNLVTAGQINADDAEFCDPFHASFASWRGAREGMASGDNDKP